MPEFHLIFRQLWQINLFIGVDSIKCYQCTSLNNTACGDPFYALNTLSECSDLGTREAILCRKLRQTGWYYEKSFIELLIDSKTYFSFSRYTKWKNSQNYSIVWIYSQYNERTRRWMFQSIIHSSIIFSLLCLSEWWVQFELFVAWNFYIRELDCCTYLLNHIGNS